MYMSSFPILLLPSTRNANTSLWQHIAVAVVEEAKVGTSQTALDCVALVEGRFT